MGNAAAANRKVRRLEREKGQLQSQVQLLEETRSQSGPDWEEVANRTALARFKQVTWRGLCEIVWDLPNQVDHEGFDRAHMIATGQLLGMLFTMAVTGSATKDEARTMDDLRVHVVHPALFKQLSLRGPPYDRRRQIFLAAAARVILRPAVPAVFKRSAETYFQIPVPRPFGIAEDQE